MLKILNNIDVFVSWHPGRLGVLLLGWCLLGCSGGKGKPSDEIRLSQPTKVEQQIGSLSEEKSEELREASEKSAAAEREELESEEMEEKLGPYNSAGLARSGLKSFDVRRAMSQVPRHLFVPKEVENLAYEDRAVKIGRGQTISQPYIVAKMTEEARVKKGSKVLEVGTGSGYQAAVLAELGAEVFSIEIIPELAAQARKTLDEVGYSNVITRQGDGWLGWPEEAPFDAIIITASSPRIPLELLKQLVDGGRLLFPLESKGSDGERLMVVERNGGDLITEDLGPVRFVPLTGVAREFEQSLEEDDDVLEEILRPLIGGKAEDKSKP
mgnify:CR=1 FL=1